MKPLLPLALALARAAFAAEQCYNLTVHVCGCDETVCDADKCAGSGGIWSDSCPGARCECSGGAGGEAASTFVDDAGVSHAIPAGATLVAGAMDAVALSHFGLDSSRILATFGEVSASGSNHGGSYYDGNIVYGELNHSQSEYDPSLFPADPNAEERAYLDSIPGDLSANCSASNYYCDVVDVSYLDENGWPDVVLVGAFYSSLLGDELRNASIAHNASVIELKSSYADDEGNVEYARSMVEMTERMEELAAALGVDVGGESVVEDDKRALCEAAESFRAVAEAAHADGVRAMASYMPYMDNPPGRTGAFLPNPDRDPVLSMMQNLGLPILFNEHFGSYWENRAGDYKSGSGDLTAEGTASASGNHTYNVDFWLYDDRVSLDFLSEQFAADWPHPALVAKQYAYWPSNARVLSYRHAAEILTIVGASLGSAERVTPATACVEPTEDGGSSPIRDLGPGEYSCVGIVPIDFCEAAGGGSDAAGAAPAQAETVQVEFESGEEPPVPDTSKDAPPPAPEGAPATTTAASADDAVKADGGGAADGGDGGTETPVDDSAGSASRAISPLLCVLVAARVFFLW